MSNTASRCEADTDCGSANRGKQVAHAWFRGSHRSRFRSLLTAKRSSAVSEKGDLIGDMPSPAESFTADSVKDFSPASLPPPIYPSKPKQIQGGAKAFVAQLIRKADTRFVREPPRAVSIWAPTRFNGLHRLDLPAAMLLVLCWRRLAVHAAARWPVQATVPLCPSFKCGIAARLAV